MKYHSKRVPGGGILFGTGTGKEGPSEEQLCNAQSPSFIFTLASLHKLAPQLLET